MLSGRMITQFDIFSRKSVWPSTTSDGEFIFVADRGVTLAALPQRRQKGVVKLLGGILTSSDISAVLLCKILMRYAVQGD